MLKELANLRNVFATFSTLCNFPAKAGRALHQGRDKREGVLCATEALEHTILRSAYNVTPRMAGKRIKEDAPLFALNLSGGSIREGFRKVAEGC